MAEGETNEPNVDDGETFTLSEVIKMQEDLDDNVLAVLGGSNEKNCSYVEVIDLFTQFICLYLCVIEFL